MFKKILIANRGEIAVRILRACRELDIRSVAVFSEVDRKSLHVRLSDEAYPIGPAPSRESYLSIDKLMDVARRAGCDAVHPGYGFLAENAALPRACTDRGLTFIGPPADAMEALGSKTAGRQLARRADVPTVPGINDPIEIPAEAQALAQRMGYPVLLKAVAGGGGKGMRQVAQESELLSAFETAQAEAAAAFGDPEIYLEKLVERPRHIEIQIFADAYGSCVHLGERECSIQRRHQKVIEECPSPIDDRSLRERMGAAAIRIAKAVNYVGAGTVEFLFSDDTRDFYFLEMNTRLQVEHPVTELVTGFDLVCEQIKVAAGARLSFGQDDMQWRGHAIECRVYAEDPENNFFPSPGKITFLRVPAGPGIRDDSGVAQGDEVSIYYDPMISKLAAWGSTRAQAIDRLRRALDEYAVGGIKTTLTFFREIVRDQEFIDGRLDTGFISRFNERRECAKERPHLAGGTQGSSLHQDIAVIAAALAYSRARRKTSPDHQTGEQSKWKTAGREASLNSMVTRKVPERR